jgi:hypothetical protein
LPVRVLSLLARTTVAGSGHSAHASSDTDAIAEVVGQMFALGAGDVGLECPGGWRLTAQAARLTDDQPVSDCLLAVVREGASERRELCFDAVEARSD